MIRGKNKIKIKTIYMVLNIKNDRALFKYNCLWGVKSKGRNSNFQNKASHTYILKLF